MGQVNVFTKKDDYMNVGILAALVFGLIIGFIGHSALNMTVVYADAATEKCVAVLTPENVVESCDSIPTKYDRVLLPPGTTYKQVAEHTNR